MAQSIIGRLTTAANATNSTRESEDEQQRGDVSRPRQRLHLGDSLPTENARPRSQTQDRDEAAHRRSNEDQDADAEDRIQRHPFRRQGETQNQPQQRHAEPESQPGLAAALLAEPEEREYQIGE
jgi:hypothetical protein